MEFKTQLLKADENSLDLAAKYFSAGEIVAVPTETVYGLAGNAYNGETIKKIFEAKGRPQDNPLIVHISDMKMLREVASEIPGTAYKLADAFWPGPLTMIMKKSEKVSPVTTAGLDSVGIRMPSDPFAHALIVKTGIPFAAPSANVSGRPSPTDAKTVFEDMNGKIPLVVDGGECFAGVESTVVSLLNETPIILRPGYVTKEDMEEVLETEVKIAAAVTENIKAGEKVLSPGMKYKHYAPNADVIILDGDINKFAGYVNNHKGSGVYAMVFDGEESLFNVPCVTYGKFGDGKSQAHELFSSLRKLDELNARTVYVRCPEKSGVSLAVYNRLIRSAGFNIIKL